MAGDLPQLFDHRPLRRLRRIPWVKALRTVSGAVTVSPNEVRTDGVVEADASLLRPSDLPVQAGDGPPPLVGGLTSFSGASVNQSQTTAFLLRAARAAFPRSRFVRDVRRLERAHKLNFEREILRQFNGPSATIDPGQLGAVAASLNATPARVRGSLTIELR